MSCEVIPTTRCNRFGRLETVGDRAQSLVLEVAGGGMVTAKAGSLTLQ
jgi:hypothetical protein